MRLAIITVTVTWVLLTILALTWCIFIRVFHGTTRRSKWTRNRIKEWYAWVSATIWLAVGTAAIITTVFL